MEDTHERSRSSKQIQSPNLSAGRRERRSGRHRSRRAPGSASRMRGPRMRPRWLRRALKTLVKVARDIYPHDMLVDSYYITAIKPWDAKAAKDPAVKAMLEDGVRRLDQDAQDRHKLAYAQVPWEADRVVLLQGIEHTDFFKTGPLRPRRLALQPGRAVAEIRLRGLLRRAWRLHQARFQRHRLAAEGLNRTSDSTSVGRISHG